MSKFNQTVVAPVAGSATVEFYVNLYKQADGSIRPGSRVFRKEANARNHAKSTVGNAFIGVEKLSVTRAI